MAFDLRLLVPINCLNRALRHLITVTILLFPVVLIAQEYPRSNGVFVFDDQVGEWMSIPPFQFRDVSVGSSVNAPRESWSRYPLFNGWYSIPGASYDSYWSTPIINVSDNGSNASIRIYIRSRRPEIDFVSYLTGFDELVSTIPPGRAIQTVGDVNGGDIARNQSVPGVVDASIGFGLNSLESMIVDDYSSEYLMRDIGSNLVSGIGDCNSCNVPIFGFVIRSGPDRFVFRTTRFQILTGD